MIYERKKIDWALLKLKFLLLKNNVKKVTKNTFLRNLSGKGLVSKIKKPLNLNNKKTSNPIFKMGNRSKWICLEIFCYLSFIEI